MQRIAITGSSGYVGGGLLRHWREHYPAAEIFGLDIVPPRDSDGHDFARLDMQRPGGLRLARVLTWLAWQSRFPLHEYPPTFLEYIRYPWVAALNRLRHELGFEFRHTTTSTLDLLLERSRKRKATKS